jgi:predicted esterase
MKEAFLQPWASRLIGWGRHDTEWPMTVRWKNYTGVGILAGLMSCAQARPWTNDKGQVIEADFVSCDGRTVELMLGGKSIRYELGRLSPADQEFARIQMKGTPSAPPAPTGWTRDFPLSKPAFTETKGYLTGRNAKAVYKAFDTGDFPPGWDTNKKDAEKEFAYADGRAIVYVPSTYDGSQPMGVYLHVSPGDGGEGIDSYAPVMDRLKMVYISPKGTSNGQPMLRRIKLAVDALASVKGKWKIDSKRVCIGGLSGGGHMSMLIHAMYPELFVGSISHAAQSYLPENNSSGHFPGLEEDDLKSKDFKDHKWCVISGDKDMNYQEILQTSGKWKAARFNYKFFDVPGMGHTNAPPEKLEEALKWMGM